MTTSKNGKALAIVDQSTAVTPVADTARTAVVLMNVGTPDAPTTSAVRRYLREFLSDPRVLDMNALGRFLLLNLIILPFRPAKSAAAYRAVWTPDGSPLLVHSRALADKLAPLLPQARVLLAMRYGNPSLRDVVDEIARAGIHRVVLVPLFPQYASASTGTALAEAFSLLGRLPVVPSISVVPPFFDDASFIDNVAALVEPAMRAGAVDHVLFSYHGLPVHQVQATACGDHRCGGDDESGCCARLHAGNASCYRAQCQATTRALAARLGLHDGAFSTSFQSRLGRARWLEPSTEDVLVALAQAGKKRVVVACPSFVSDCLETIEEIGVRGNELFRHHGGDELVVVPCVNAAPDWVDTLAGYVRRCGAVGPLGPVGAEGAEGDEPQPAAAREARTDGPARVLS